MKCLFILYLITYTIFMNFPPHLCTFEPNPGGRVYPHYRDSNYSEPFVWEHIFKDVSPSFHCLISATDASLPLRMGAHAWLAGFASHGSGLHLGAGCQ